MVSVPILMLYTSDFASLSSTHGLGIKVRIDLLFESETTAKVKYKSSVITVGFLFCREIATLEVRYTDKETSLYFVTMINQNTDLCKVNESTHQRIKITKTP